MKILSLTAGAAEMYCGSCLRDNALARELIRQGHDVSLVPVYTPTKVEGRNVSADRVLFGGISVYLQQHSAFFRNTPWIVDRLLDSDWALRLASRRSIPVNPKFLGEMTVSMLRGGDGPLAKEFGKLEYWLSHERQPDVINLPNALLISMARSMRHVFSGPVCCTMQGEDLFLENLEEPYRTQAIELIQQQVQYVDAFVAVSGFYAELMARFLAIPREKVHVVRLGVELPPPDRKTGKDFILGYLARIAPEKGLHLLCEAWRQFRQLYQGPAQLRVAGYLAPEHRPYLEGLKQQMKEWGLAQDFRYEGELDERAKQIFLSEITALSVPTVYDDAKGLYVLEAMAAGAPVVQPRRGAVIEHVSLTGGGLLVEPDSPQALAQGFLELARDPAAAAEIGRAGRRGVERHYSVQGMAEQTIALYQQLIAPVSAMA